MNQRSSHRSEGRTSSRTSASLLAALALLLLPSLLPAQTVYAVVLGHQRYVVGSSTLNSGLYRSSDLGKTWTQLGPRNLKAYSMDAVDRSRGKVLYIAAGNGVHRSTDAGKSWKITTDWRMTEVLDVKVDQKNPKLVYAATAWGFWRSTDGGDSWENPPGHLQRRYIYRLDMHRLSTMRYPPHDNAEQTNRAQQRRRQLDDHVPKEPLLFASTADGVYYSSDQGASWSGFWEPGYQYRPSDAVWPYSTRGIFPLDHYDHIIATESGLRHEQPARDWQSRYLQRDEEHRPAPAMPTYDVVISSDRTIYAAGDSGVWQGFQRRGLQWTDITGNLPVHTVHALALIPKRNILLAGAWNAGIFRRQGDGPWEPSGLEGSQVWRIVVKNF